MSSNKSLESLQKNDGFKCMRNTEDGSIYYGEVGYMKNGALFTINSPAFDTEIKPLNKEQRMEQQIEM